ncbi:hypothetical protein SELMODRAFT_425156 [Selaginella moellendorffii]|uniref:Uncharacterized protein n=1 Tax=Selaginella moellendorffii TaxID=88036 RepID=D8SS67_SELML|nr:hypothetical protein SELMODRAFT_425156 [Selaginella moellendorffii]
MDNASNMRLAGQMLETLGIWSVPCQCQALNLVLGLSGALDFIKDCIGKGMALFIGDFKSVAQAAAKGSDAQQVQDLFHKNKQVAVQFWQQVDKILLLMEPVIFNKTSTRGQQSSGFIQTTKTSCGRIQKLVNIYQNSRLWRKRQQSIDKSVAKQTGAEFDDETTGPRAYAEVDADDSLYESVDEHDTVDKRAIRTVFFRGDDDEVQLGTLLREPDGSRDTSSSLQRGAWPSPEMEKQKCQKRRRMIDGGAAEVAGE